MIKTNNLSGVDTPYGLADFISMMSQPSKVWQEPWHFPRFYTWSDAAKDELFDKFNYDYSQLFRGTLSLQEINFEHFKLPHLCTSGNMSEYCSISKKVPDLKTTMELMQLAKYPLKVTDNLKSKFR